MSTWKLSLFGCDTPEGFNAALIATETTVTRFLEHWSGKPLGSADVLATALADYNIMLEEGGPRGLAAEYANLRFAANRNDAEAEALKNRAESAAIAQSNRLLPFVQAVKAIPTITHEELLNSPLLSPYRTWLREQWGWAPYELSEEAERILALKNEPAFMRWFNMIPSLLSRRSWSSPDENGKVAPRTFAELQTLATSPSWVIRSHAAECIDQAVADLRDVAEIEIGAQLEDWRIDCEELRRIPRPDTQRLVSDLIEPEVVDALVAAVQTNYGVSQRFYRLRARLLGKQKLNYHERAVRIEKPGAKEYGFEEAMAIVCRVLGNLHPEFAEIARDSLSNGQIDSHPRPGKAPGAFCTWANKRYPSFVLLNHTGQVRDVTTIAHELGHAIQFTLVRQQQIGLNLNASTATAEVASTFMEDFVFEDLRRDATGEVLLSLLIGKLDLLVSNIHRQIACWSFEWELHQTHRDKRMLSADVIGGLFNKHMGSYMGDAFVLDDASANNWVSWGHVRNFFYVYSYAFGILLSLVFQARVRQDPKSIREFYDFIAAGRSLTPREAAREAGIDITNPEVWQSGLAEFEQLLNEAEALADSLGR